MRNLIRPNGLLTVCTVALAVLFVAALVGCSQQSSSCTCDKQSCQAKCSKTCSKDCTKPCGAKAAGKPINETCPMSGKPIAEGITTTCCGKTVGFCSKECLEHWKKLSKEEQCKKLGCKEKCGKPCKKKAT